ncbi:MAG: type VI secretion system baseplate subunit TssG [Thermoguttaceae bacterium]
MAPPSGRNRPSVAEQLQQEAWRFDFFQAVRLLESIARQQGRQGGDRPEPVGHEARPDREVVRFRALASLSFPAGSVAGFRPASDRAEGRGAPPELLVACMGLFGPSGVLPPHYTCLLIQRIREKDYSLRDFLDLFNHRTLSLFYRAWEKYRFPIGYERAQQQEPPGEDLFTQCLYCLIGWGTGGLRGRLALDDQTLLFYAGFFAHFPRCGLALECILADFFQLPVRVNQFQGQWLQLSIEDQTALPSPQQPARPAKRLGEDLVLGQRVWEVQSKFRVRLGPLSYPQFRRFMPSGDALRLLCHLVRSFVGPQLDFDVQPVLRAAEVPWCRLGGDRADPARLGWNSWVRSGILEPDAEDAVFSLEA